MSDHGRPRGRARPHPRGLPPPHVTDAKDARRLRRLQANPRLRHLLQGNTPPQGSLFDQPEVRQAYGGMTCCYCDRDVSDLRFERAVGGRLRCYGPACHAADEREKLRAGEAA